MKFRNCVRAVFVALSLMFPSAMALAQSAEAQAELEALIKAAKSEGEVFFYSGSPETLAKRIADGFTAKYGIKAGFIRLAGVVVLQRFSAEAEAGTFAADLFIYASGAQEYFVDAAKKGWVEPVSAARIPVVLSGQFPARFLSNIAIVQVAPWGIGYNTDRVKGTDIPKDWNDLLHPRFKGQIIIPDPRSSDAYSDVWGQLLDKLGEGFFAKLREQGPRFAASGVPAMSALAAGEGLVSVPTLGQVVTNLASKGGPVSISNPALATGVEQSITLTHRSKGKHPAAARLFAHYIMSPDGNKAYNADPGSQSIYDLSGLPKQYEGPKPNAVARRDLFMKLLGAK